jgi:hypothetical protein
MKTLYAALFVTGALFTAPSVAGPLGSPGQRPVTERIATPVATFDCRRDDRGWHYMRSERRVTCRPDRPREGAANLWGWRCEGTALRLVASTRATLARPRLGFSGRRDDERTVAVLPAAMNPKGFGGAADSFNWSTRTCICLVKIFSL